MLRRPPTRIEIKASDLSELNTRENIKANKKTEELDDKPYSTLFGKERSTGQRIGLKSESK